MEKGEQKRARSDLLRALLRVSLFERFYARLISDVIIVSQEKSLYLYYSVLNPVRQAESAKFGQNLTLNGKNHKCPQGHSTIRVL